MAKKVLVRSRYREVRAKTGATWRRDEKGNLVDSPIFRQFSAHHAWMSLPEAAFLCDSDENAQHLAAGLPPLYYYPAGAPLPVDEAHEGPLAEPFGSDSISQDNPQQANAARKALDIAASQADAIEQADAGRAVVGPSAPASARRAGARSSSTAVKVNPENPDAPGDSGAE